MSSSPYAAPKAAVADIETEQEYQEIQMWSASGRIGRLRYLAYSFGSALLCALVAGVLGALLGETLGPIVAVVAYIVLLVFTVIVTIKRSHDMDWSGWTALLTIIPLVALIWVFKSGTPGTNSYGAPPPPNTTGVKILAFIFPVLFVIGIVAAVVLPMLAVRSAGM